MRLLDWAEIPWDELAFPTVHWVLRQAQDQRGASGPIATVFNPLVGEG